ncbi:MAG: phosphate regulatory protein [Candidatus Methanoperedens nitroreducens]|uniref:Phosphate regulatory protein n=1 Tax=Candidatus Methanoperedens nitratireducens TaxID=1392998 RepID=A0A0P8CJX2_9EURY|nr:phosphate uptake regulator PhoU [Candidatus Methanoperedens sp. BLZ2]KAB2944670.1 MAG: phosphate uptake regulator PhoU [Candidatus Methanoperedens sp.]KPQ43283.1 MAG: phosphate regulatory protein [Candidatus Methanoperedens sp. BLZ1]MBZ0175904.1 phosphate uptake regulator PhoU [Candidatus Methanoperedens nitroreducens]MCX9076416.1 phosphate uptake regulator PhoU [Candidatus Methanoperedens sp.]
MINAEIRKVQITGKSTFVVSLPKKWAVNAGITSGSLVHMHPQEDGSLLLTTNGGFASHGTKTLTIDGSGGDPLIRDIIATYVAGYRVIELKAKNITMEQRKDITAIVKKLIGIEIIEETNEKVVIQDISNPGDMPIDMSFRRMHIKVQWMLDNTFKAMNTKDVSLASEVVKQDDEIDRLNLLISKQFMDILLHSRISEKSELGLTGAFYYRLASDQLERISDHASKIAGIIMESGEKIPNTMLDDIIKIGIISYKLVNDSVGSFTKCNVELANRVIEEHKKIGEELRRTRHPAATLNPDAVMSLGLIADSVKRIGDYAANVAELAIDFSKST